MRVIVEKAFGRYPIGHVISDMPGNQARTLIARHLVRDIEAKDIPASPVNRMMRPPERKAKRENA